MIRGAHGICDELPHSNTAKPYPLDQVYENIEATSTSGGMPESSTPRGKSTKSSANRPTSEAARPNKIWNAMIFFTLSICSVYIWH